MVRKKDNFCVRNYKKSWNYLKESRKFIFFSIVLFILFFTIAIIFPTPISLEEQIKEIINQLIDKFDGKNIIQTILMIFGNNALVSLIGLFLGIFFAFVPFILAVSNGYVVGYVCKIVVGKTNVFEMWRLIPHGIFELPAVFISLGLGIKLGTALFNRDLKNVDKEILERLKNSFRVFVFVVLPLLVVAAIIEGVLMKITG
jgi:stage II sporulation protein M